MKPSSATSTIEEAKAAFSPDEYTITIRKEDVEGDACFVGRVAEFPDLMTYEESGDAAYVAMVSVLTDAIAHLREVGKEIPSPQLVTNDYSGRVTFRMPRSLHARVDARAQLEGVSINTWLVAAAENYLGTTGQLARCMPNTLFLGSGIAGVHMTSTSLAASETAVAVMKSAIAAANTSLTSIIPVMIGGASSMGAFNEPEDESPVRPQQH